MSKVYLVGAGPGDPGLLTLRGKEAIARADAVVYDYLANPALLAHARPDAEIIYVGKKGGEHTLPQDKINDLLVRLAASGKTVARLKGGDPYVFGRGGEEAEELVEAGVDFEVVPGVTSAVAATAYAGIPVTHRAHCSSVSFITGHEDPTKADSAHQWRAWASDASTLVFFMGVKNLPDITARLIEAGRPAETPAALIRWGTTCRQRTLTGTLADIAEKAKAAGFKPPSLFVVGGVVALRDKLGFFEKRPLFGQGVVVTRSREQASGLTAQLSELGACVFEFPTIATFPLDDDAPARQVLADLSAYDWIVFTSVNGVGHFFAILEAMGLDARALAGARVAAIGPATAEALAGRGIRADATPEKYVAESVVETLLARGAAGSRVLIPRARQAREVLPEKLAEAGARVTVLPVYETRLDDTAPDEVLAALAAGEITFLTFSSSSTVDNFFAKILPETLAPCRDRLKIACIGPVTAATLEKHGFTADVMPADYTIPALVAALVESVRSAA